MNEAIKLALEKGGYVEEKARHGFYDTQSISLDPLFWQALGKALGWRGDEFDINDTGRPFEEWKIKAHQYFDLILIGGDTEKFWKELLTAK